MEEGLYTPDMSADDSHSSILVLDVPAHPTPHPHQALIFLLTI